MPMEQLQKLAAKLAEQKGRERKAPFTYEAWDSLDRIAFLTEVETHFKVELDAEEIDRLKTLEDLDGLLEKKLDAPKTGQVPKPEGGGSVASKPKEILTSCSAIPFAETWWRSLGQRAVMLLFGSYYPTTIEGLENVPAEGSCIIVANHTSHLDGLLLLSSLKKREKDVLFLAARDYFFSGQKLGAFAAYILPIIPLDREGNIGALRQNLRQLNTSRRSGRIIVMFPEGTRSRDGRLQPFRGGFGYIALHLDVPVVPCLLSGCFEGLPRGAWFPKRRRLRARFGAALSRVSTKEDIVSLAHKALRELGEKSE
jgi:long-chain acyl-CoA synthetase